MNNLETLAQWITTNIRVVYGVIWFITISVGAHQATKYYRSEPKAERTLGSAVGALIGTCIDAALLWVLLIWAFAIPYFLLVLIVRHEDLWQVASHYISMIPPKKWHLWYEYATYLATLAGLIQFLSYVSSALFGKKTLDK